jgi:hypothetical protein
MKTSINPKQCCRYSWSMFPKLTIKKVLELNPWLFNHSYNFFAYYDDKKIIPKDVFELEKNWLTDNFVLFSGSTNDLKDYINRLDWDNFGTWYVYLYPTELKADKPIIIGRDNLLEKGKGESFVDYFNLGKQWEFIHRVNPDMFITKQKNGVMIGSLNELNLWCVETETKTKKR